MAGRSSRAAGYLQLLYELIAAYGILGAIHLEGHSAFAPTHRGGPIPLSRAARI